MIPEPDYSDTEDGGEGEIKPPSDKILQPKNSLETNGVVAPSPQKENQPQGGKGGEGGRFDAKGLVLPKKVANPCQESLDVKRLHKELIFNQKLGINVLNQKSELQKVMEKRKDKQALKEAQKEKQSALSPLQKAIDERAMKIEKLEKEETGKKSPVGVEEPSSEFKKIHAKVLLKNDK